MINVSLLQYIYTKWVKPGHPVQIAFIRMLLKEQSLQHVYFDKVFEQHDLFILKKFTQNNVERKVHEFVKAYEKKLKFNKGSLWILHY